MSFAGILSPAQLASARGVKEALLAVSRDKSWITEKQLALCRIPAPTFFEEKRAEWFLREFRQLGCEARLDEAGNVICFLSPNAAPPYVAVTAHLDTVLSPRSAEEIRTEPGGRLLGPGVSDNGPGLAALLALVRCLKSAPEWEGLTASPVFVANVGEEGEGNLNGMRHLATSSALATKIRSYLVLDGPGAETVTVHALASRRVEIAVQGPGGHSWSDFGTGNPVHALGRFIGHFTAAAEALEAEDRFSFNFGLISGGSSVTSIPTEARVKVDLRSASMAVLDRLSTALERSLALAVDQENTMAVAARPVTARIRELGLRPGGRMEENAPLLRHLAAVDQYLGIRPYFDCASTDANIPLSLGIPAICLGAGGAGGGAHTPQEWYRPDARDLGLQRILLLLAHLLME